MGGGGILPGWTSAGFPRGSHPLTGEGREEGGESQFWKVKEDLEDLGVTCIWSLDTSAGLPRRHTSVFSFLSRIQNFV